MAERSQLLEKGDIYFLYRPKVEKKEVKSINDVQRFYIVLSPQGKNIYRLITVGKQSLPEVEDGGERNWGFVSKIGRKAEDVEDELDREVYDTKTRGQRELEAARPAGEGVYAIVRHGDHTHLAYTLELPKKPGEVQREFRIEDEASYIISVKNPQTPSPRGAGLKGESKAEYPKRLQELFEGRRFADAEPDFLDFEGTELVLIGATENPLKELQIELKAQNETEATAEIFKDLRLERDQHPIKPLIEGKWE